MDYALNIQQCNGDNLFASAARNLQVAQPTCVLLNIVLNFADGHLLKLSWYGLMKNSHKVHRSIFYVELFCWKHKPCMCVFDLRMDLNLAYIDRRLHHARGPPHRNEISLTLKLILTWDRSHFSGQPKSKPIISWWLSTTFNTCGTSSTAQGGGWSFKDRQL